MGERPVEVEVARTAGGVNADAIVAALHGSGIPARIRGEAIGALLELTLDGLGEVSIVVPEEYAERAREVLAAAERGVLRLGDAEVPPDDPAAAD